MEHRYHFVVYHFDRNPISVDGVLQGVKTVVDYSITLWADEPREAVLRMRQYLAPHQRFEMTAL